MSPSSRLAVEHALERVVVPGIAEAPVLGAPVVEPELLADLRRALHVRAAVRALVELLPPALAGAWYVLRHWSMIRAMPTTLRVLTAEALGTFYLCFAGIAAIVCTAPPINSGGWLVAIALAHGLAFAIAVNNFGGISGPHVNPALTIGMLLARPISAPLALLYIVVPLLRPLTAALTL